MKITGVKITKSGATIKYTTSPEGAQAETVVIGEGKPRPELEKALDKLIPAVGIVCEFPKSYNNGISVSGVNFAYKKEQERVVVIAHKKLKKSNAPFNVSTPPMLVGEDEEKNYFPPQFNKVLEEVKKEAEKYINGKRAQQEMQFEDDKKENTENDNPEEEKFVE